ncbi:unnamed protein product, partial [Effrenium voratum]
MLCPRCSVVQQKRNWRPAQWRSSDPYIHGNLGCKQCGCASDEEIDTHLARVGKLLSFAAPRQGWLDSWMERWTDLGRSTIKWLSHHGTLQCRPGAEAEDPGTLPPLLVIRNAALALALRLIWPTHGRWLTNAVTAGDYIEAIFGVTNIVGTWTGFSRFVALMVMNLRFLVWSLPFTTSQLLQKIWTYSDLCEVVKSVDLATRRRAAAA